MCGGHCEALVDGGMDRLIDSDYFSVGIAAALQVAIKAMSLCRGRGAVFAGRVAIGRGLVPALTALVS